MTKPPRQRTGHVRRKRRGEPDRRSRDHVLKKGDRVRLTEAFKKKMRGKCAPGKHVAPLDGEPPLDPTLPDHGCFHCSTDHIEEFGESEGIVQGPMDYNNCEPGHPDYDPKKVGPEVDVRWEPDNLRYGYNPKDLERVRKS